MDIEKVYFDAEGCSGNIMQIIKREPEWAANRIQAGEHALDALKKCIEVLRLWHGPEAFEIYYDHSPEMKPIRDVLPKFRVEDSQQVNSPDKSG